MSNKSDTPFVFAIRGAKPVPLTMTFADGQYDIPPHLVRAIGRDVLERDAEKIARVKYQVFAERAETRLSAAVVNNKAGRHAQLKRMKAQKRRLT